MCYLLVGLPWTNLASLWWSQFGHHVYDLVRVWDLVCKPFVGNFHIPIHLGSRSIVFFLWGLCPFLVLILFLSYFPTVSVRHHDQSYLGEDNWKNFIWAHVFVITVYGGMSRHELKPGEYPAGGRSWHRVRGGVLLTARSSWLAQTVFF